MIKTLIFDWGGVLTVGKYTQSILENISERKNVDIEDLYSDFDELVIAMNAGDINFDEFVQKIEEKMSLGIDKEEMKEILKKSIRPNEELIDLIKDLKSDYNLIMLSNNDEMTVSNLEESHKYMLDLFSEKYFSHSLKMRKPNPAIFEYALKNSNLTASECVFVDDKQKNIDVANEIGMKGILFTNTDQFKKDISLI